MTESFRVVPIDWIVEGGDNVRTDIGDVTELAASIKRFGILQPLVVTAEDEFVDEYILVAGHRRLAAAKSLGLEHVPVVERELTPDERVEAMLSENLHRKNLSIREEGEAFRRLMRRDSISQDELARRLGISQTVVANRLAFFKLSAHWQREVLEGNIGLQRALNEQVRRHKDSGNKPWPERKARWAGQEVPSSVHVVVAFGPGRRPEAVHAISDRERAFNVRDELARTCKVFIYPCEIDTTKGDIGA